MMSGVFRGGDWSESGAETGLPSAKSAAGRDFVKFVTKSSPKKAVGTGGRTGRHNRQSYTARSGSRRVGPVFRGEPPGVLSRAARPACSPGQAARRGQKLPTLIDTQAPKGPEEIVMPLPRTSEKGGFPPPPPLR